jgi:hypothetical protein
MTWSTFRKKYNPDIYSVSDSSKGWIKETIKPTLSEYGFKHKSIDIDSDERTPADIVKDHFYNHEELQIVYYTYSGSGNYSGYFKYLEVFYKPKT